MFEKEAEKYKENKTGTRSLPTHEAYARGLEEGFEDGAEFGYQEGLKAKINTTTISDCPIKDEWQYVSEKGTPKTEGHYLVCLRNKDKDILDCWILYDKDVGWYSMQIRIKDIYAWKEIVPPKEGE